MIYTLFFSRMRDLSPEEQSEYLERSSALQALALDKHPGFVDVKSYWAADGERLTVARFRDAESQHTWRSDPMHKEAQVRGRMAYYEEYRMAVCEQLRERSWHRSATSADSP